MPFGYMLIKLNFMTVILSKELLNGTAISGEGLVLPLLTFILEFMTMHRMELLWRYLEKALASLIWLTLVSTSIWKLSNIRNFVTRMGSPINVTKTNSLKRQKMNQKKWKFTLKWQHLSMQMMVALMDTALVNLLNDHKNRKEWITKIDIITFKI